MDTMRIRTDSGVVEMPARMPDSFTFEVFLPSRGVRTFTAFLDSRNVALAEVRDVLLASPESDPRVDDPYEVDADEQGAADEAAGDIMERFCELLGLTFARPQPVFVAGPLLPIALAYGAEVRAYQSLSAAWSSLHGHGHPYPQPDPTLDMLRDGPSSQAVRMLETLLERTLDRCVLEQQARAKMAEAAHRNGDEAAPGSERGFSGRGFDATEAP